MPTFIKKVIILFFRMMPLKKNVVIESYPDFSDNADAFYKYLVKKGYNKKHKIYWALHDKKHIPEELPDNVEIFELKSGGFKSNLRRMKILYTSKYIFDCNSYIKKRRKSQVRIHFGHGMLIKITPDYHNKDAIGEIDGFLTTGTFFERVFTKKIKLKPEVLLPFGYPRNDVLVTKEEEAKPYIMWLPTYRQHKNHMQTALSVSSQYGLPEIKSKDDLYKLDKALGKAGIKLMYRPHPAQEISLIDLLVSKLPNIVIADDNYLQEEQTTLYEMLRDSSALITDYSSVYYDYLLTGKPIGLTIRDAEEYFETYNCPFGNLKNNIIGFYINSRDDVVEFINQVASNSVDMTKMNEVRDKYHDSLAGDACEKIYNYLVEKYGFDKER